MLTACVSVTVLCVVPQDFRKRFSDHWRAVCKGVRFPPRDTVFDYYLHADSLKFEPWKNSPAFQSSRYEGGNSVAVPTPESVAITFWVEVGHAPT